MADDKVAGSPLRQGAQELIAKWRAFAADLKDTTNYSRNYLAQRQVASLLQCADEMEALLAAAGSPPQQETQKEQESRVADTQYQQPLATAASNSLVPATDFAWPQDAADLVEMALEWGVPESDGGDMFSGDVLIRKLGLALQTALAQAAGSPPSQPAEEK